MLIKTDRLTIRDMHPCDLDEFFAYRSDPSVAKYQGFDVMTKDQATEFIHDQSGKSFGKAGEWIQYSVEAIAGKKLLGDCSIRLNTSDIKVAEIGITIAPLYQQNGFASEALSGIVRWLFETKGIECIVEIVDAQNIASIKLLKHAGFRQKGEERKNVWFKGSLVSEFDYEMNKQDWIKFNPENYLSN